MKKLLLFALIAMFMSSCAHVCRHEAMANAAMIIEDGHTPEFVLYTTNPVISLGIYNAHVQATYVKNGQRVWYSGAGYTHDAPEYPVGKYAWIMDINQYIEWLRVNKELSGKPMPSEEDREKYWPNANGVIK